MSTRIHIHLPEDLARRVDDARGDVSRSRWIVRALESALHAGEVQRRASAVDGVTLPGPPIGEQIMGRREPEVEAVKALADAQVPVESEVKEKEPSVPSVKSARSRPGSSARTSPRSGQSSDPIPKIARRHWA